MSRDHFAKNRKLLIIGCWLLVIIDYWLLVIGKLLIIGGRLKKRIRAITFF